MRRDINITVADLQRRMRTLLISLLMTCCAVGALLPAHADDVDERRIHSGLKFFRTLLLADEDIESHTDADNKALLLIVYASDKQIAERFAEELLDSGSGDKQGQLRNLNLKVEVSSDPKLQAYQQKNIAGIFVAQATYDRELTPLISFSREHNVILYSPFEGHVEKGVMAGLTIDTRVLPYLNVAALDAAHIRLKAFFLKAARHYEP